MKTTTKKPTERLDKLVKKGTIKKKGGKETSIELWEIHRKGADGKVMLRGYTVIYGSESFYYGPAFYDKLGENNSCLNMALRKFDNPTKPYPWPKV